MLYTEIISRLGDNYKVFKYMLIDSRSDFYLWKPSRDKWCTLEIVCKMNCIF